VVEGEARATAAEDHGWTVLATTVDGAVCPDADMRQASHDHKTTVEPGWRWSKNPAAIAPVWREQSARSAAVAMLTVLGLLVSSVSQRQVRLSLRTQAQPLPGHQGLTATPTAVVVVALVTQGALGQ
jgi:adenosyl cobinamide kinase/adenosyl cobinamide phosphate guanylyltransferase